MMNGGGQDSKPVYSLIKLIVAQNIQVLLYSNFCPAPPCHIHLSINPFVRPYICLYVFTFIYPYDFPFLHPSVYLSAQQMTRRRINRE